MQTKFRFARLGAAVLLGVALIGLAAPLAAVTNSASPQDSADSRLNITPEFYLESARAARDQQQWEIAEIEYQNVLLREPTHLEAMLELTEVYEQMGRYEHARALLSRATDLDPGNKKLPKKALELDKKLSQSLHVEIDSLINGRAYESALPRIALLLTLEPENPDLHYLKSLCHYHLARYDIALSSIERALLMRGEQSYHDLHQAILTRAKQNKLHALMQKAAHVINPTNEPDRQSALTLLASIIELDPDNIWAKQEFLRLSDDSGTPQHQPTDEASRSQSLTAQARQAAGGALTSIGAELTKYTSILLLLMAILLLFHSPLTRTLLQGFPQHSLLTGNLARFSIAEILTLIHSHDYTGTLTVKGDSVSGKIYFEHGEAYHCKTRQLRGKEALMAILNRASSGQFYFKETKPPVERTIEIPLSLLIMDLPNHTSTPDQPPPKRAKSKITELLESR
jgi:tetratricopeptide (TPR) repeat protein